VRRGGVFVLHGVDIIDENEFLKLIFWDKRSDLHLVRRLIEKIARGEVSERTWRDVVEELEVSNGSYYRILRRLRILGLVEKDDFGMYRLSSRFSKKMREIAGFWDKWRKELEEEELRAIYDFDELIRRIKEDSGFSKKSSIILLSIAKNLGRDGLYQIFRLIKKGERVKARRKARDMVLNAGYNISLAEWFSGAILKVIDSMEDIVERERGDFIRAVP